MKRLAYLTTLSVIALVMLVPAAGAQQDEYAMRGQPTQNVWSVGIEDFYFEPPNTAIAPGDKIIWSNKGRAPHAVTANDGSFDSGVLNPGDTYTVTFLGSGTVTYHCTIHPNMVGSVTVGGEAGGEVAVPIEPPVPTTPEYSALPDMTSMGGGY